MTTLNTSDLTGAALDWAVTKIEHPEYHAHTPLATVEYSSEWDYGGPIIARALISVTEAGSADVWWTARMGDDDTAPLKWEAEAPTPLEAAMRCYVASKLGDTVEVPDALA